MFLCVFSAHAAAENVWQSTLGQDWFYESRAWAGEQLAGTWWEGSLSPGNTYEISFEVHTLQGGVAGLLVGERDVIPIDRKGWHSYEFSIRQGGKRRLMFVTKRNDMTAGVRHITVRTKAGGGSTGSDSGSGGGGGGNALPKGHWLTFDRERNLKQEVLVPMDDPGKAKSGWHLNIARDIDQAFRLSAVKGFGMRINWRSLEKWDGGYDWKVLDANMEVARRYGLKFFVQIGTRSFNGENVLPGWFPGKYVIWSSSGGKSGVVAKMWDSWVYTRLIRLHKAIARRYANDSGFGGIASTETSLGNVGGDFSYAKYRTALIKIATETQAALSRGRFIWYLNFVEGGDSSDMRRDARVDLVNSVPNYALTIGAPDTTPDLRGMPGSVNSYRIHLRKTKPHVEQFCSAQNRDQGLGGINKKSNQWRHDFINRVESRRRMEQQYWFDQQPAIFVFDDIYLHPEWRLGEVWNPAELFSFADRNFHCDYFFWHYRENVHNLSSQFWWEDIRPVIVNNPHFYR